MVMKLAFGLRADKPLGVCFRSHAKAESQGPNMLTSTAPPGLSHSRLVGRVSEQDRRRIGGCGIGVAKQYSADRPGSASRESSVWAHGVGKVERWRRSVKGSG